VSKRDAMIKYHSPLPGVLKPSMDVVRIQETLHECKRERDIEILRALHGQLNERILTKKKIG
jgi:hypothetical protein